MRLIDADNLARVFTKDPFKVWVANSIIKEIECEPTMDLPPARDSRHDLIKWISVNDVLPEPYKAVLGYTPYHNNIWAVTMHEDGRWYIWAPVSRLYDPDWDGQITYWMPMPEPPKEVDDAR